MRLPVLLMIFNRPALTARMFEAIRKAKPPIFYIAQDGPRPSKVNDLALCEQTRAIVGKVDWPCSVKTLYRKENVGSKIAISSAIDWFFREEDRGIILEDDLLPHPTFFPYCEHLLEKYKDVDRVKMISGANYQDGIKHGTASYYFSKLPHAEAWATWRRAWKAYDIKMSGYPEFLKAGRFKEVSADPIIRLRFKYQIGRSFNNKADSWDGQWLFAIWKDDGVVIVPNVNMVERIGYTPDAEHCRDSDNKFAKMKSFPINEIVDPSEIVVDRAADSYDFYSIHKELARRKILRMLKFQF